MPVWHELTKELRAQGRLEVIGVVQEQHPDRAHLYAQWQGLDFPILWDPFNTLGVEYVLIASFIDEWGRVQKVGLSEKDPAGLRALLQKDWKAPDEVPSAPEPWVSKMQGMVRTAHAPGTLAGCKAVISRALWSFSDPKQNEGVLDSLVKTLELRLDSDSSTPADRFRAGVARRLRFDSRYAKPGDLQASLDHWVQALQENPNQYIWRRRIQQWGPRLDKPYPFYDWVSQAFSDLEERGNPHSPLVASLTGSERAGRSKDLPQSLDTEIAPDPDKKIHEDKQEFVRLEAAVVPHSKGANPQVSATMVRVHITLDPMGTAHWTPDADAAQLWLDLPDGWKSGQRLRTFPLPPGKAPTRTTSVDFEVRVPQGVTSGIIRGYAVYSICDANGACLFRRQTLEVDIQLPTHSKE